MKATAPWRGRRDALRVLGGLALAPLAQSHAQAQATSWPTRPIKVLIGVPAGGTQDVLTRAIADAVKTQPRPDHHRQPRRRRRPDRGRGGEERPSPTATRCCSGPPG